jgi:hypothetical protein
MPTRPISRRPARRATRTTARSWMSSSSIPSASSPRWRIH